MKFEKLSELWKQDNLIDQERIESIAETAKAKIWNLERILWWRDLREIAACVFILIVAPILMASARNPLVVLGLIVMMAAAIQVGLVLLWVRWQDPVDQSDTPEKLIASEIRRVDRQIWLLSHVDRWYLIPLGISVLLINMAQAKTALEFLGMQPFNLSIFGFIYWINRRAVRKQLTPLRKQLTEQYPFFADTESAPSTPLKGFKIMGRLSLAFYLGIFGIAFFYRSASLFADRFDRQTIEEFGSPLVDAQRVDGLLIGVIKGDREWTVPIRPSDGVDAESTLTHSGAVCEIGSISKVFTSLLLADAVAKGEIDLDSPIEVPGWNLPRYEGKPITWKQLSTHRSGFPRLPSNMDLSPGVMKNPYAKYDTKMAKAFLNDHKLKRKPGSKREYSNFGAALLGSLLADRSGMPYEDLLQSVIASPLEMEDITSGSSEAVSRKLAQPHKSYGNPTPAWDFADMPGAGGIRASLNEMMKFARAQLDPPEGALGEAIELAWKKHADADAGGFAMGLGWLIARDGQTRWHNGRTGGSTSAMFVNRQHDTAVVVLSNTSADAITPLAERILQRAIGMPVKPMTFEREVEVPLNEMKRLEGKYPLAPTFVFDVRVVDGKLMVGITNQPTQQVFPKSPTEWFYKSVDATLIFDLPKSGQARAVTLDQNNRMQRAPRAR